MINKEKQQEDIFLGEISRYLQQDIEYKAKGTWEDILRFAEKMQEEKRNTEALILEFRIHLSQRVATEELMFAGVEFKTSTKIILKEFDKHFNITTKRYGKL